MESRPNARAFGPPLDVAAQLNTHVAVTCARLDEALVKAALGWLVAQAAHTHLDAIIVVSSIQNSDWLKCALSPLMVCDLVGGKIIRMHVSYLQLILARDVMPRCRRDTVVLSVGLDSRELTRVQRMNAVASMAITVSDFQGALGRQASLR